MSGSLDSKLIFERYLNSSNILETSISNHNIVILESYKKENLFLESLLEEGLGDFFKKIGTGAKNVAGKIKGKLEQVITNEIVKRISKEEAKKAVEMIESGNFPKDEIQKIGKSISSTVNECTLYSDVLTKSVMEDLLYSIIEEARKPLTAEQKARKNELARKRRAEKKSSSVTKEPTESEVSSTETDPLQNLNVKQYINGIVNLINKKYATANKKAKVYSAIDSKIRNKLGQDVNDVLRKNQVFSDIQKISAFKTAKRTKLSTHLINYISNEFVKFCGNKGIETDLGSVLSNIFKNIDFEKGPKTFKINGKEVNITPPAEVPNELNSFVEWYKEAIKNIPELVVADKYRKFEQAILKKVNAIKNLPETNKKIESDNAEIQAKKEEIVDSIGSPNEEIVSDETKETKSSFLSKIWNWIKEHKVLTSSSIVALISIIAYVSGGTSLLLPLIYKGLKTVAIGSTIGTGISAGKQMAETGKIDWKRAAKAGASVGLANMGMSMIGGLIDHGIQSAMNTSDSSNTSLENSTETESNPETESNTETGSTETVPIEDSKELFKKLNNSTFDPKSKIDVYKKNVLDDLLALGLSGKELMSKYYSMIKRNPSNYSW